MKIEIDRDTTIKEAYILNSNDIFLGNNYLLKCDPSYYGPLFIIKGDSNDANRGVTIRDVRCDGFSAAITTELSAYLTVENLRASSCQTGLDLDGEWDGHFSNINITRCVTGVALHGNCRASVPVKFFDLHIETFRSNAIEIDDSVYNLEFFSIKVHGNPVANLAPTQRSIICKQNVPVMSFFGGQFFFNPNGHFSENCINSKNVFMVRPMHDNSPMVHPSRMLEPVRNRRNGAKK